VKFNSEVRDSLEGDKEMNNKNTKTVIRMDSDAT
jgi:hypothetical protein